MDSRSAWPEPLVAVRNQSNKLVLLSCGENKTQMKLLDGAKFPLTLNNGQLPKGTVHPKLKHHPFSSHHDVDVDDIFLIQITIIDP